MSETPSLPPRHQYEAFLQRLPADWEQKEITQVGAVVGGGTPSRAVPSFWRGSIPWVTPGEVSGEAAKLLHDTNDHISASGLAGSGANLLPAGSLLVTTRATLGARVINAVPMATNQGFKSIVFKKSEEASYYYHLFEKVKPELVRRASGTTFLEISGAEFGFIKVPSPSPEEKLKIAELLDTLDTAIHQTEFIVEKLKQVKQGLLHDLLTRGVDANGELRPSHEEAPDLYQESPLGWIPKDWDFGNLEAWLAGKPKNGYSPQEARERTGIQMLGLGCLTTEGFSPVQLKAAPFNDKRLQSAMLSTGDLLISRANTRELVGLVGVYKDVGTPCTYPDLMMRLKPCPDTSANFLQLVLQTTKTRRQIQAHAVGTSESMVKISGKTVSTLLVALPKNTEQSQILERMAACDVRLKAESDKAKVLREIKAGLMDDLLTGRVRATNLIVAGGAAGTQVDADLLLSQLCKDLYEAEELAVSEYRRELFGDKFIPELVLMREGKIRVEIRKENVSHNTPHLHIKHSDKIDASISLLDFSTLAGQIDSKTLKFFLKKLKPLKANLLAIWNELNEKENSMGAEELISNLSL